LEPVQSGTEVGVELDGSRPRRRRQGAHDHGCARSKPGKSVPQEMSQAAFNGGPGHGAPHRTGHDHTRAWGRRGAHARHQVHDEASPGCPRAATMPEDGIKVPASTQTLGGGEHRASGGQAGAALGTTAGEDGTTGAGAHAEPKTMRLGPPTVVRLEGALAHGRLLGWTLSSTDGVRVERC